MVPPSRSLVVCIMLILALIVAPVQGEAGTDGDFFYLRDPDAAPVREYVSEPGMEKNLFRDVRGPKVVEFYSPLCVSAFFCVFGGEAGPGWRCAFRIRFSRSEPPSPIPSRP